MFVDYSGLQRFSSINRSFAHQFIQFLEYESLDTIEQKLQFLKSLQRDEVCIQRLAAADFIDHSGIIDYLFKLSLSIKQMQEVSDVIRRCPTAYSVEIFDTTEANFDIGDVVAWAGMFLRNTYDTIRKSLCDDIKQLIIDLKPEMNTSSFQDWHLLQRYLFHGCCQELPKFMEPKTTIVIIPMDFPKIFMDKVNKNGFMDSTSNITFYTFAVKDGNPNLLANFNIDSLVLKPTKERISTIWKDGVEKNYIGTIWKPLGGKKVNNDVDEISRISKTETIQPDFVTLFQSDIDPIYTVQDSNLTSSCSSAKSEFNPRSEKDGSIYDIFSPLSSKELPTALTPANNSSSPVQEKNYNYMVNFEKEKPKDYTFLPPPPSFLPCYNDFESSSPYNQKQGFRYKFKQFCSSSHLHLKSRHHSCDEKSSVGFDATGLRNWEDLKSPSWDWSDTSTRQFLHCKMKKWKNNCHYYRAVAKQCIEEFHDSTLSN